jgi:hypothetical protein
VPQRPACRHCAEHGRRSVLNLTNTDRGEFLWCMWCDRLRCNACRFPIPSVARQSCPKCGIAIPPPKLEVPPTP